MNGEIQNPFALSDEQFEQLTENMNEFSRGMIAASFTVAEAAKGVTEAFRMLEVEFKLYDTLRGLDE